MADQNSPQEVPKKEEETIQTDEAAPEERLCRFCFDGESAGELISPCKCSGGQKYVHLTCLRMWQKAVLGSQPTHPDLYDVDSRQRKCNVCNSDFTCPPPTRAEMLASFTGPELAALIEEGSLIGSAQDFSDELQQQLDGFPEQMREEVVCRHWVRGVFMIVKVASDRGLGGAILRVDNAEDLGGLISRLGVDMQTLHLRGRRFRLLPEGLLEGLDRNSPADSWRDRLRQQSPPINLSLEPEDVNDCGEDAIVAVNLTRRFDISDRTPLIRAQQRAEFCPMIQRALMSGGELPVEVSHFIGGPCEEESVSACMVLAAGQYKIVRDGNCLWQGLQLALESARRLKRAKRAPVAKPAAKRKGLKLWAGARGNKSTCSRKRAILLAAQGKLKRKAKPKANSASSGSNAPRPTVRRRRKRQRKDQETETERVQLYVFWGYAGWTRCQLMGEIARGSWGLCQAKPGDVPEHGHENLWQAVYPRMMLAPKNDMSETYRGEAPEEEARRRLMRRMALFHELIRRGRVHVGSLSRADVAAAAAAAVAGEGDQATEDTRSESDGSGLSDISDALDQTLADALLEAAWPAREQQQQSEESGEQAGEGEEGGAGGGVLL